MIFLITKIFLEIQGLAGIISKKKDKKGPKS